jgi:hypothetical protein
VPYPLYAAPQPYTGMPGVDAPRQQYVPPQYVPFEALHNPGYPGPWPQTPLGNPQPDLCPICPHGTAPY